MSASDRWGDSVKKCPCGGIVEYWYFGPDCRGNGASAGAQCKKCGKKHDYDKYANAVKEPKYKRKPLRPEVQKALDSTIERFGLSLKHLAD